MSIPILFPSKDKCSGCSACYSICPMSAISMIPDQEGFQYPIIDEKKCIDCRQCINVCPFKRKIDEESSDKLYKTRCCEKSRIKVGIITHYYKSTNYGGLLQAYALCTFLQKKGYNVEQICYDKQKGNDGVHKLKRVVRNIVNLFYFLPHIPTNRKIKSRTNAFVCFREKVIPHSQRIYSKNDIDELASSYDVFITGSDQVWHPYAVCDAYLLDFPNKNIKKMSYAASVSKNTLTSAEKARYKNALKDYYAISVREKSGMEIIQTLSDKKVEWVCDPVFLLTTDDWDNISREKVDLDRYIFCYFLGSTEEIRKSVREFSERKKLKIVNLPFLMGKYQKEENRFGDIKLYDVSPQELLGLIKKASYIFTDSFHIMSFSLIFGKQFFVFERSSKSSMSSRIESLAEIFYVNERFCNCKDSISASYFESIVSTKDCGVDYNNNEFIKRSSQFLLDNLRLMCEEDNK